MNIEEIKKEAIYSDNPGRLFEITVELTEELARLHVEVRKTKSDVEKAEIKGKMAVLLTIQDIIKKRIDEVIKFERESERKELLSNRHFKIAAELVLTKETFARIKDLSLTSYKKIKEQKSELKANKLE